MPSQTRVGIVETTDISGQEGTYKLLDGSIGGDFIIHKPDIYVVNGDSIKIAFTTPSGVVIAKHIVLEVKGREI